MLCILDPIQFIELYAVDTEFRYFPVQHKTNENVICALSNLKKKIIEIFNL